MPYVLEADKRPMMKITDIIIPKDRVRKEFTHIMDLKSSIEELGILQPIVVTLVGAPIGKALLMAGECRIRAASIVSSCKGMVPVTIYEALDEMRRLEVEVHENMYRGDVAAFDQIEGLRRLDELKRAKFGVGGATTEGEDEEDTGWSIKKTAQVAGMSEGHAAKQIGFAKKLNARPELKEKVKHLPITAAMRVFDKLIEAEKSERLVTSGEIQLTTELENLDAFNFLRKQKDDSIDLFLTDPPFGMEELSSRQGEDTSKSGTTNYVSQMSKTDNLDTTAMLDLLAIVSQEMFRTLKPGCHSYIFFDLEFLGELKEIFTGSGFKISWPVIIWDKQRTTTIFRGYNYQSCFEAILFCFKPAKDGSCKRLFEAKSSILRVPSTHASKKIHVFEKPLDLLATLIKQSTNHGEIVCDPFAGSASTLVAAKQTGRRAIGCELAREHFLAAQARLLLEKSL